MEDVEMKKITTIIAIASVLLSCSKSERLNPEIPGDNAYETGIFHATMESHLTKTTLSDNGAGGYDILWATTDRIGILDASRYSIYKPNSAATACDFTYVEGGGASSSPYYAYYPSTLYNKSTKIVSLPVERTLSNGILSEFPMYATSSTTDLGFKNLCGVLRLHLSGTGDDVMGKVVLSADEPLAGEISIVADGPAYKAVATGINSITLNVSGTTTLSSGYDLWIPVPEGSYSNVKIKVYKADGTYYGLKTAKKAIEVERSRITEVNISSLALSTAVASLTGSGTVGDPYQIASEADVEVLRELIDLGDSFSGKYFKVMNNFTITKAHKPLGALKFADFDGNGCTITLNAGFDLSAAPTKAGFFSEATSSPALIHDLTLDGSDMTITLAGSANMTRFGVIVGEGYINSTQRCDISKCHNKINVTIQAGAVASYMGGLAGYVERIDDSSNTGNIIVTYPSGTNPAIYLGGVSGRTTFAVQKSRNTGHVTFNGNVSSSGSGTSYIGGITGESNKFRDCINEGDVTAYSRVTSGSIIAGGIVANLGGENSFNSYNTGSVLAQSYSSLNLGARAGGIVGTSGGGAVYNCYNSGNVKAWTYSSSATSPSGSTLYYNKPAAGGIAAYKTKVYNCYNTGTLETQVGTGIKWYGGAILGLSAAKSFVQHCYFLGTRTSATNHDAIGLFCSSSDTQDIVAPSVINGTSNQGMNCSGFGVGLTTYYLYSSTEQGRSVTINETSYPAADPGTDLLTLLNAGQVYYCSTTSLELLPWKAGTGDPAYPIFDE